MAVIGDREGVFEVPEVDEAPVGENDNELWNNRLDLSSILS
jgi:hypothetical protein